MEAIVDRITALLVVRLAAIVAPLGTYPDLSIAGICRSVLVKDRGWPREVTPEVIAELKEYVSRMVKGYKDADEVYYHNREHCYHVVLSACKLMDMFLANASASATSNGKKGPAPPSFGLRNDPVMLFSLAFAALIHDVEHQGAVAAAPALFVGLAPPNQISRLPERPNGARFFLSYQGSRIGS